MFSARRTTVSSQVLMRRQHRRLRMERLQERWMLATVYWASHEVNPKVNNPVSVFAADFDGDGDADIVSASYDDGKIAWFENTDGRGAFGPPHARSPPRQSAPVRCWRRMWTGTVTRTFLPHTYHAPATIGGSMKRNVRGKVCGIEIRAGGVPSGLSKQSSDISTTPESPVSLTYTPPTLYSRRIWTVTVTWMSLPCTRAVDQAVPLDVSPIHEEIAWSRNTDGGGFATERLITAGYWSYWDLRRHFEAATAADLDGDGDADVISAVPESGKIAWYENTDGQGTFVRERVIDGQRNRCPFDLRCGHGRRW